MTGGYWTPPVCEPGSSKDTNLLLHAGAVLCVYATHVQHDTAIRLDRCKRVRHDDLENGPPRSYDDPIGFCRIEHVILSGQLINGTVYRGCQLCLVHTTAPIYVPCHDDDLFVYAEGEITVVQRLC